MSKLPFPTDDHFPTAMNVCQQIQSTVMKASFEDKDQVRVMVKMLDLLKDLREIIKFKEHLK